MQVSQKLRFCHKLWFSNPYIFPIQCGRPLIFQSMNYVRSNNLSLKYQMFTPTGCKDIEIWTFKSLWQQLSSLTSNIEKKKEQFWFKNHTIVSKLIKNRLKNIYIKLYHPFCFFKPSLNTLHLLQEINFMSQFCLSS